MLSFDPPGVPVLPAASGHGNVARDLPVSYPFTAIWMATLLGALLIHEKDREEGRSTAVALGAPDPPVGAWLRPEGPAILGLVLTYEARSWGSLEGGVVERCPWRQAPPPRFRSGTTCSEVISTPSGPWPGRSTSA